ncbi:MAG: long-subunit fatty acid transport protein [Paraglaciecola sp.]
MKLLLITVSFFLCIPLFSQNGAPPNAGARGTAMGNASVAFDDLNGGLANQAALANLEGIQAGIFAEQRFLIADLNSFSGIFALPTNSGTFGLAINYFGFSAYNEQKIGVAYARKFSEKVSVGAQIDYLNTSIEEYGNKGVVTFELGLQFELSKELRFGTHIYNPIRSSVNLEDNLPTIFKIGAAYTPADNLVVAAEIEQDLEYDSRFKMGIEYGFLEALDLRVGIQSNPTSLTFGLGLNIKENFFLDFASAYHQVLGFSPSIGIIYRK